MGKRQASWILSRKALLLLDASLAVGAVLLAYFRSPDLRLSWETSYTGQPGAYPLALLFALAVLVTGGVVGLHDPLRQYHWASVLPRVGTAVLTALGGVFLTVYLLFFEVLGRTVMVETALAATLGMTLGRYWVLRIGDRNPRRLLLLLGATESSMIRQGVTESRLPFELIDVGEVGHLMTHPEALVDLIQSREIDEVIVPWSREAGLEATPWVRALHAGVQVTHYPAFLERHFYKVDLTHLGANWLSELDLRLTHPIYHRWKRFLDVTLAVAGIVVSFPMVLGAVVLIALESGRPIFFRQERVGLRGKVFWIWKLRTMRQATDDRKLVLTAAGDPRITRVGRWLRRTRFDEVPQFINILRGEMSFIGPRPDWVEIAAHCERRIPAYRFRTLVKPGLTGWAQINYRYAETDRDIREKLSYDFYYMRRASAMLDLQIFLRTVGVMMKGSR